MTKDSDRSINMESRNISNYKIIKRKHYGRITSYNVCYTKLLRKPLTNSLSEAIELRNKVKESGLEFCLTHNYTGYPMVRQAREMVKNNDLGIIRLIQVEYVQGGKADESVPDRKTGPRSWKFDRNFSGPSLVLGDIGSHRITSYNVCYTKLLRIKMENMNLNWFLPDVKCYYSIMTSLNWMRLQIFRCRWK